MKKRYCYNCKRDLRLTKQLTGGQIKSLHKIVFPLFGGKCYYCRKPAQVLDHILPLALGGTHALGNLAAACRPCNSKKGASTIHEFAFILRHKIPVR